MFVKKCDKCFRPSYSSTDKGQWLCPYEDCKKDITHVSAQLADVKKITRG